MTHHDDSEMHHDHAAEAHHAEGAKKKSSAAEGQKAEGHAKMEGKLSDKVETPRAKKQMDHIEHMRDSKDEGSVEDASKKLSEMADEAAEHGYAEDALTDDQKVSLAYEQSFADDAEEFEADEDGEHYVDRRKQV